MDQVYVKNRLYTGRATTVSGQYNFAQDGGAQGTITSSVFIPGVAVIERFVVKVLTAPVGAGASISFGITGNTQFLMVATGVAAFIVNTVIQGVDFNANPAMASATVGTAIPITMTITAADLTAGRLIYEVTYTEYDL